MISHESRQQAAESLLAAYQSRQPVPPLTETYPGIGVDDGYVIQLLQVAEWEKRGASVKGHKVGLTAQAMRQQLGVDEPDFGHLMSDMFYLEAQPVDVSRFIAPRIEPEIAFVLRRPLAGPGVNVAEAAAAVDFVMPALEIIDSRIRDWKITLVDTIADNASSVGAVLAGRPVRLDTVDLREVACALVAGDGPDQPYAEHHGEGKAVLGSPLNALVWLANTLGERGTSLAAGQVILPGSMTAAVPVRAGSQITVTMTGLGSVSAQFA